MGIPSMNRLDDSGYYDGSRVFSFLVEPLGLSVDQVRLLKSGFFFYYNLFYFFFLTLFFRSTSFWASLLLLLQHLLFVTICTIQKTRHGSALLLGLIMVVFCFGRYIIYWFNENFFYVLIQHNFFPLWKNRQALHIAMLSSISYAILMTASPKISHK